MLMFSYCTNVPSTNDCVTAQHLKHRHIAAVIASYTLLLNLSTNALLLCMHYKSDAVTYNNHTAQLTADELPLLA
jgi:hypothetical protein